ncbi:hypothetical protein C8R44DRAFT_730565 [Mycena epipterygia]|nr:hypothetical protein C8R44DRAFT_730565 [Mycena epipterygia]
MSQDFGHVMGGRRPIKAKSAQSTTRAYHERVESSEIIAIQYIGVKRYLLQNRHPETLKTQKVNDFPRIRPGFLVVEGDEDANLDEIWGDLRSCWPDHKFHQAGKNLGATKTIPEGSQKMSDGFQFEACPGLKIQESFWGDSTAEQVFCSTKEGHDPEKIESWLLAQNGAPHIRCKGAVRKAGGTELGPGKADTRTPVSDMTMSLEDKDSEGRKYDVSRAGKDPEGNEIAVAELQSES